MKKIFIPIITVLIAAVAGIAPKLLMSGDHVREEYDEVGAISVS